MKISKEKNRVILSLTEKEMEELEYIVSEFDGANIGVFPDTKEDVALGRKWCKYLGLEPCGSVTKDY